VVVTADPPGAVAVVVGARVLDANDVLLLTEGLETKYQSAATGSPRLVSPANFFKLKPTRLSTDAVRFVKYGL
jgi:hypothetical protein